MTHLRSRRWGCKCCMQIPPHCLIPLEYKLVINMVLITQINQKAIRTTELHVEGAAAIARLLRHACPAAVAWLIPLVVVHTIQGETIRARPHVFEECCERRVPCVTHLDSAPAIARVVNRSCIIATLSTVDPCAIFTSASLGFTGMTRAPVDRLGRSHFRNGRASATSTHVLSATLTQQAVRKPEFFPTVAATKPRLPSNRTDHKQSTGTNTS